MQKIKGESKANVKVIQLLKRSRSRKTPNIETDENQSSKRFCNIDKQQNAIKSREDTDTFDQKINHTIENAVKIYHNVLHEEISKEEKVAYLTLIKRFCNRNAWNQKRIISSQIQIECIMGRTLSEKEEARFTISFNKWAEDKIMRCVGKTKGEKVDALANSYKIEIKRLGVLDHCILDKIREINHLPTVKSSTQSNTFVSTQKLERCRLCGENSKNLVININQKSQDVTYKTMIEFYCKISVNEDPKLPQLVCIQCKNIMDSFTKLCDRAMEVQKEFEISLLSDESAIKQEPLVVIPRPLVVKQEAPDSTEEIKVTNSTTIIFKKSNIISSNSDSSLSSCELRADSTTLLTTIPILNNRASTPLSQCSQSDPLYFDYAYDESSQSQELPTQMPQSHDHPDPLLLDFQEDDRCSMRSEATSCTSSRKNVEASLRPCSVKLYKLPIIFVPSETEESESEEEGLLREIHLVEDDSFSSHSADDIDRRRSPIINVKYEPVDSEIETDRL